MRTERPQDTATPQNACGALPNGAYIELGQLESASDYQKYQGRSFSLLLIDEAGQFADASLLDILRSNLRGPKTVPIRVVMAANPGGPGHHWLAHRYVFREAQWTTFEESKSRRIWVYAPSTFDGNRFIDREQYREQLEASCPDDAELLRAWVEGDWLVARGAYFADCLSETRNAVPNWTHIPEDWTTYLAHDFGSAAPSVTYLCASSPGQTVEGVYYPRNSIVLVDELATHRKGNYNAGLGWTVPVLADAIRAMCAKWKVSASGVADDAIFARTGSGAGSIAEEFRRERVHFQPARKADRLTGWNKMRRMLAHAGEPDRPGLYIARACSYFWGTVPMLSRDSKRIEDVDSSGPDHGADAARYGSLYETPATFIPMRMAY